jgi:hypothetical protein
MKPPIAPMPRSAGGNRLHTANWLPMLQPYFGMNEEVGPDDRAFRYDYLTG